jgi:hypothetical protein
MYQPVNEVRLQVCTQELSGDVTNHTCDKYVRLRKSYVH